MGSLQETIYSRTHFQLDWKLSKTCCQVRESYQYVRGLLSVGLRYDNLEKMSMRFCNHFYNELELN